MWPTFRGPVLWGIPCFKGHSHIPDVQKKTYWICQVLWQVVTTPQQTYGFILGLALILRFKSWQCLSLCSIGRIYLPNLLIIHVWNLTCEPQLFSPPQSHGMCASPHEWNLNKAVIQSFFYSLSKKEEFKSCNAVNQRFPLIVIALVSLSILVFLVCNIAPTFRL